MVSMLGLGNVLDRYPSELSMGQKSRAGLLSAFAMGRSIVILDEFGSNLDQQNQEILFAFVREFGKGKTIILATHSEALAHANCDILIPVPENGEF